MKPIVTLMFLFTVLFIGSPSVQAESANPFGFETNTDPLEYEYCQKVPNESVRGYRYTCSSAPRPHPDLQGYSLQFVEGVGLCRIRAGSTIFALELDFNDAVEVLKDQIAQKYGPPTKETKEEDTTNTHSYDRRVYWSPETGFQGRDNVQSIEAWVHESGPVNIDDLEAIPKSRHLTVSIQLVTSKACLKTIEDKANRAF